MSCKSTVSSKDVWQNVTRNNCGSGCTGSSVSVHYPDGVGTGCSQSEANANALTAWASQAQAYANANGTCNCPQPDNKGTITIAVSFSGYSLTGGTCSISGPVSKSATIARTIGFSDLPYGTYSISFTNAEGRCNQTDNIKTLGVTGYTTSLTVSSSNKNPRGTATVLCPN